MLTLKTNIQKEQLHQLATCLGAWALTLATLVGATEAVREPVAVLANEQSTIVHNDPHGNDMARRESENETAHMAARYDVGLRIARISGRK